MATRRIAAHRIVNGEGSVVELAVVSIVDGHVSAVRKLDKEIPFTEWLGGTVELRDTADGLRAYHNGILIV